MRRVELERSARRAHGRQVPVELARISRGHARHGQRDAERLEQHALGEDSVEVLGVEARDARAAVAAGLDQSLRRGGELTLPSLTVLERDPHGIAAMRVYIDESPLHG